MREKRRKRGAMPRGLSHHYDTAATGGRGMTLGGTKGTSTKMPSSPKMGTNQLVHRHHAERELVGRSWRPIRNI